mmetsp:Transcript_54830/g.81419  ORF Transcript_54830/g.81419 Transcript_54830/m.81419 type:complete len:102 (+) Transcript_54830:181-486(+)
MSQFLVSPCRASCQAFVLASLLRRLITSCSYTSSNTFKYFFNLSGAVRKWMIPKLVTLVSNELNESDEKTPRVGPMYDHPFEKHPGYLFLNSFVLGFAEQE